MGEAATMRRNRAGWGSLAVQLVAISAWLALDAEAATPNNPPPPGYALALHSSQILAVIGIRQVSKGRSPTNGENLQDRRIGFGLNTMLAQELYDTRKFRLIEDRDVRRRQILEDLVNTYWVEPRPEYSELDLRRAAEQLDAELLAYGSVSYTVVSTRRMAIGPVTRFVQKLGVTVNICVFHISAHRGVCRESQGMARQEGVGVIYEFRNDRLDFEKNALGKATKQAVEQAVQDLMASIYFPE